MNRLLSLTAAAVLTLTTVCCAPFFQKAEAAPGDSLSGEDSVEYANLARLEGVTSTGWGILSGKDNIFDGDKTTHADMLNDGCYVQLDLGEPRVINRWVVTNYDADGSGFLNAKYSLWTSDEPGVEMSDEGYTKIAEWDNQEAKKYITDLKLDTPVTARYVRLKFHVGDNGKLAIGDNQVRLREWELYGDVVVEPEYANLARLEGVTSTGWGILSGKDNIFDGDKTTHADMLNDGCYVQLDLGEPRVINRWVVTNYDADGSGFLNAKYSLWTSDEPGVEMSDEGYTKIAEWDNQEAKKYITDLKLDTPVTARYVRLKFHVGDNGKLAIGDNQVRLREWELYGDVIAEPGEGGEEPGGGEEEGGAERPEGYANLARLEGVTAAGEGILSGKNNAIDGDEATHAGLTNDGCYLQLDLGEARLINHWVVVNWNDFGADYLNAKYSLWVSDEPNAGYEKIDEWDNQTKQQYITSRALETPVTKQYVRLYFHMGDGGKMTIAGDQEVRLREFELYGDVPAKVRPEGYANLARLEGVTAAGEGILSGKNNAIDGDETTHAGLTNDGCYLQLDLGEARLINHWVVVNWNDFGADYLNAKYSLWVSDEPNAGYEKIDEWDNQTKQQYITSRALETPVTKQYVRLYFHMGDGGKMTIAGDQEVRLREFELYGDVPAGEGGGGDDGGDDGEEPPILPEETRPNIATGLGKDAYTCGSDSSFRLAFDGSLETHADLYCVTEGEYKDSAWVRIDLGQVRNIDRWTVYNYLFGGNSNAFVNVKYQLLTADSPNGPWTVRDVVDNEKRLDYKTDRMLPEPVDTQYVMIQFLHGDKCGVLSAADDQARVDEIELYGNNVVEGGGDEGGGEEPPVNPDDLPDYTPPANLPDPVPAGTDIAATRPDTAFEVSGTANGSQPAFAFDRDNTTWWTSPAGNSAQWIGLDLGRVYMIDRWLVENYTESPDLAVTGYALQVSVDNAKFVKVDTAYDVEKGGVTDRRLDEPVEARYVRLYIPFDMTGKDRVARITTFSIFGTGVSENENDYNLNTYGETIKSTENLLNGMGDYVTFGKGSEAEPARNAVDNDMSTTAVIDEDDANWLHWLRVDMQKKVTFDRVVVYPYVFSDGSKAFVVRNFDVQVSDDGETWRTVANVDNQDCQTKIEKSFEPVAARYIRLAFNRVDADGKRVDDIDYGPCLGDNYARVTEWQLFNDSGLDLSGGGSKPTEPTNPTNPSKPTEPDKGEQPDPIPGTGDSGNTPAMLFSLMALVFVLLTGTGMLRKIKQNGQPAERRSANETH